MTRCPWSRASPWATASRSWARRSWTAAPCASAHQRRQKDSRRPRPPRGTSWRPRQPSPRPQGRACLGLAVGRAWSNGSWRQPARRWAPLGRRPSSGGKRRHHQRWERKQRQQEAWGSPRPMGRPPSERSAPWGSLRRSASWCGRGRTHGPLTRHLRCCSGSCAPPSIGTCAPRPLGRWQRSRGLCTTRCWRRSTSSSAARTSRTRRWCWPACRPTSGAWLFEARGGRALGSQRAGRPWQRPSRALKPWLASSALLRTGSRRSASSARLPCSLRLMAWRALAASRASLTRRSGSSRAAPLPRRPASPRRSTWLAGGRGGASCRPARAGRRTS
mmetsp:Transcript_47507/g.147075  ORF Transcript_47507/g.147075 Transcript_47507/m.147075 type:complete len:332 (+) Transcript_47507:1025-2020(+)